MRDLKGGEFEVVEQSSGESGGASNSAANSAATSANEAAPPPPFEYVED